MKTLLLILVAISITVLTYSQEKVSSIQGNPSSAFFNINQISTVLKFNGISDVDIYGANSGLVYPKGSGKASVFQSGVLWGALVRSDSSLHIGGSAYRSGLQGGKILNYGFPWQQLDAEDEFAENVRIYRVRKDVFPGCSMVDLDAEIFDEQKTYDEIHQQYEKDWIEWPANDGAPFEDINSNGLYEPTIDIPGYPGAHQTLWFVANDLSAAQTEYLYNSLPIGIELQVTIWGYTDNSQLNNMFFKKYKVINKSNEFLDSMFISIWSDPDLGNATDDFVGCDTLLNLAYAYNSTNFDAIYSYSPTSIGFKLLNGPIRDEQNKLISSFHYRRRGEIYPDEIQPSYIYNEMNGKYFTGLPFIDPRNYDTTKFPLSGNPFDGEGWIEGIENQPSDRRMMLNAGPFVMSPSDTQEIVFAEIAALGGDNINSLRILHYYSIYAQELYNNSFNFAPILAPEFDRLSLSLHQYLGSIELLWENNELNNVIENYNIEGYTFQGYNLYQLYSNINCPSNGKLIETFDKIDEISEIYGNIMNPITGDPEFGLMFNGSDSGIKRKLRIDWDYINNSYLRPNDKYYYGVTAYFYNLNNPNSSFEIPIGQNEFIFQENLPGPSVGDSILVTHTSGNCEAKIEILVVDPYSLTGHDYIIYFTPNGSYKIFWNLKDVTLGNDILLNQEPYLEGMKLPSIDGFQIKLVNPTGFKSFSVISNSNGILNPEEDGAFPFQGFPTPNNQGPISGVQQATNSSRWAIHSADENNIGTFKTFNREISENDSLWEIILPNDYEIRFTQTGSKACKVYDNNEILNVPFELWNVGINTLEEVSDDYRMIPWIFENANNLIFDISGDHSATGDNNDPYSDWFYWANPSVTTPGQSGYLDAEQRMLLGNYDGAGDSLVMAKMVLVNWNGGATLPYNADMPETGTTFRITTHKSPIPGVDEFTFNTERLDTLSYFSNYSLGQNYPNPFNPITTIIFKLITRVKVEIDVYNIIGEKIITLVDTEMDPGIYSIQFDANTYASGVYFYQLRAANFIQTKKMVLLK
jgi:hypothetical protein